MSSEDHKKRARFGADVPFEGQTAASGGKAVKCKVELYIHLIQCPAATLSKNGRVFLVLQLLDHHARTHWVPPKFPLFFSSTYECSKRYDNCNTLGDLQANLENETVTFELVQETDLKEEVTLATFDASAREIFFPLTSVNKSSARRIDLDLIMEQTVDLPSLIPPKIEISTKLSVSDAVDPRKASSACGPKPITTPCTCHRGNAIPVSTLKRVSPDCGCDETLLLRYRPPFVVRKAESRLLTRRPGLPWRSISAGNLHRNFNKPYNSKRPLYWFLPRANVPKNKRYDPSCGYNCCCCKCDNFFIGKTQQDDVCAQCRPFHKGDECRVCSRYKKFFGRDSKRNSCDLGRHGSSDGSRGSASTEKKKKRRLQPVSPMVYFGQADEIKCTCCETCDKCRHVYPSYSERVRGKNSSDVPESTGKSKVIPTGSKAMLPTWDVPTDKDCCNCMMGLSYVKDTPCVGSTYKATLHSQENKRKERGPSNSKKPAEKVNPNVKRNEKDQAITQEITVSVQKTNLDAYYHSDECCSVDSVGNFSGSHGSSASQSSPPYRTSAANNPPRRMKSPSVSVTLSDGSIDTNCYTVGYAFVDNIPHKMYRNPLLPVYEPTQYDSHCQQLPTHSPPKKTHKPETTWIKRPSAEKKSGKQRH